MPCFGCLAVREREPSFIGDAVLVRCSDAPATVCALSRVWGIAEGRQAVFRLESAIPYVGSRLGWSPMDVTTAATTAAACVTGLLPPVHSEAPVDCKELWLSFGRAVLVAALRPDPLVAALAGFFLCS